MSTALKRDQTQPADRIAPPQIAAIAQWRGPFAAAALQSAVTTLEDGRILYFPRLAYVPRSASVFSLRLEEQKAKNISYAAATGALKGTNATGAERTFVQTMMADFSATATRFVLELLPSYAGHIELARTSYRPVEIAGREYSRLKDDRLLHIDAFPSTPTKGRRILRLFSNINPSGKPRVWHVGEPFEEFIRKFAPALGWSATSVAWFLAAVGATRSRRSAYDQLMLDLHNGAKRDTRYQREAPQQEIAFPAGSTWLCFTDQVLHAAISGQYALEQTYYVDIEAMADPASSPLRALERMTGRKLS
jgi:3-deoxy-D-manno-oct-2-ulosonic acid (Kdo) hydroxylase